MAPPRLSRQCTGPHYCSTQIVIRSAEAVARMTWRCPGAAFGYVPQVITLMRATVGRVSLVGPEAGIRRFRTKRTCATKVAHHGSGLRSEQRLLSNGARCKRHGLAS